ncbi:MAG: extracellular solute-binding protein [Nitratireductor sp.]|nr:extracellular solute-binding protein [Nitratireductor sp.]
MANSKSTKRGGATTRRSVLKGAAAAGSSLALASIIGKPALAQTKPESIMVAGLQVPWRRVFEEEVAPDFEKQTGIRVDFEWLSLEALTTRLITQLPSKEGAIDVCWYYTGNAKTLSKDLADINGLFDEYGGREEYNLDDVFDISKHVFTLDDRLIGMPFRYATDVLHYRPDVLEEAGFGEPPRTFQEMLDTALAVTEKSGGARYGIGAYGMESTAMVRGWVPFLLSNEGHYYDYDTWEILVNKPNSVDSLQFLGDLFTKYKVVPPEATTWEWEGLTSGAQTDRFAMTSAIGAYGQQFNHPTKSKTHGRWAWTTVPGSKTPEQSRSSGGGWAMGIAETSHKKQWAFEFTKMATSTKYLKNTLKDSNCPPRNSVLKDPDIIAEYGWTDAVAEQARTSMPFPNVGDPVFLTCNNQIKPHVSRVLLGKATAQEAMDDAAAEWERTFKRVGLK